MKSNIYQNSDFTSSIKIKILWILSKMKRIDNDFLPYDDKGRSEILIFIDHFFGCSRILEIGIDISIYDIIVYQFNP